MSRPHTLLQPAGEAWRPHACGRCRPGLGTHGCVRVDTCGPRPGLCAGMIVLTRRHGSEVILAIRPGMWITRGDRLVLLEELRVGDQIHVPAFEMAGAGAARRRSEGREAAEPRPTVEPTVLVAGHRGLSHGIPRPFPSPGRSHTHGHGACSAYGQTRWEGHHRDVHAARRCRRAGGPTGPARGAPASSIGTRSRAWTRAGKLRAAVSLSRLWRQQGKRAAGLALLTPVYGWFTEGFDAGDLQEAKALLAELEG